MSILTHSTSVRARIRRGALLVALTIVPSAWLPALAQQGVPPQQRPPNGPHLLVVYVDDMPLLSTFSDFTGFTEDNNPPQSPRSQLYSETPVIDSLAAQGLRFYGFRTSPLCSPSRASLITGRHAFRHGVGTVLQSNFDGPVGQGGLAEFGDAEFAAPSIVQVLSARGVRTAVIGKVHLSTWITQEFSNNPGRMGSGWEILHRVAAPPTFLATQLRNINQAPIPSDIPDGGGYYNYFANFGYDNDTIQAVTQYATSWQIDRTIEFFQSVGQHQRSFCFLSLNACHSPYGKRSDPPDLFRDYPPPGLTTTGEYEDYLTEAMQNDIDTTWPQYMASLEAVDAELGRLLASIPSTIRDHLSILLLGDNGVEPSIHDGYLTWGKDYGPDWNRLFQEHGATRVKGSVYHWGSTTCAIWSGPGRDGPVLPTAGTATTAIVDMPDIAKSAAEFFGVPFGPSDGISFLPLVYDGIDPRAHLRQASLSERFWPCGDWRLIQTGDEPSEKLERSYHCWLDGAAFSNGVGGKFSLVRKFQAGFWHDELYLLEAEDGSPADRFEFDDLLLQGGFDEQYEQARTQLMELLDSTL